MSFSARIFWFFWKIFSFTSQTISSQSFWWIWGTFSRQVLFFVHEDKFHWKRFQMDLKLNLWTHKQNDKNRLWIPSLLVKHESEVLLCRF
jgi:nitrate reductase gamma subunit